MAVLKEVKAETKVPKGPSFVFIGDKAGDGPATILAFGYVFPKGKPVEVRTDDKHAIAKLTGNGHFKAA